MTACCRRVFVGMALAGLLLEGGCNKQEQEKAEKEAAVPKPARVKGYFKTSFQNESQYIVEAILRDITREMCYAAHGAVPNEQQLVVEATEKPGSGTPDAPVYEIHISWEATRGGVKSEVQVTNAIWSAEIYREITAKIANAMKVKPTGTNGAADAEFLERLTELSSDSIERENEEISKSLEKNFLDPVLHEKAAMLLGAFLLREHSGQFYEIRSPLCRMTAHLAMADYLRGSRPAGIDGQMAEAVLLTLEGDQAQALEKLKGIGAKDEGTQAFVRALRVRNTGNFQELGTVEGRTQLEIAEWFAAMADYTDTPAAWSRIGSLKQLKIDYVRIMGEMPYSVEIGHNLLQTCIPLELSEEAAIYELSHGGAKLKPTDTIAALNEMPDDCFGADAGGKVRVHVIGWGQWAASLQRHLCNAIVHNHHFMLRKWGVPDEAKEFAKHCEQQFGGLRMYAFVKRFTCSEVKSYHESVDEGFKYTVATPQYTPAGCWNELCYKAPFADWYRPNPNPHINEWHEHNPPPGTVYNLNPRLDHPSLIARPDVVKHFERLRMLAPYDCRIAQFLIMRKYKERPTYEQVMEYYGPMLSYSMIAISTLAGTVADQPERFEKIMLKAAELNPSYYYNLADYWEARKQRDRAAEYMEKACNADQDAVRVSNRARWRVTYYLEKGDKEKARKIADEAGEIYSFAGLEAKAMYLEGTSNYVGALEWYTKIEERYKDSSPVLQFCLRYQSQTGDKRFEPQVKKRLVKLFPNGLEQVSLTDFHGPPTDGVLIQAENDTVRANGLNAGDVIVAVYGVRMHNMAQYTYGREMKEGPEVDLIVWHNGQYGEFKPNLSNHRFGVNFGDYVPNKR